MSPEVSLESPLLLARGRPNGAAAVGAIYIDIENANIYINTDAEGSWKLITRADSKHGILHRG